MNVLRPIARAVASGMRRSVDAISTGLDGMTRLIDRLNGRFEAHLRERTKLLRAHYANTKNRQDKPLPVVEAPIDLSLRDGVRKAA